CVVLSYFFSLLNFHEDTLRSGRKSPPEPLRRFGTSHSPLVHGSTDESAGDNQRFFDSPRQLVYCSERVLQADDCVRALQVACRVEGLANASSSKQLRGGG